MTTGEEQVVTDLVTEEEQMVRDLCNITGCTEEQCAEALGHSQIGKQVQGRNSGALHMTC